ncbi:uncharacterized protein [Antedon mediterranea]|uniref:uncharacterized protein n=1 Tax=Antedon mediterranea TaxID=105859 RepID=UPI003AF43FB2
MGELRDDHLKKQSSKLAFDGMACHKLGVQIYGTQIGALFFADDVVLIGDNESELVKLLKVASDYSQAWKLEFNFDKSNVLVTGQRVNPHRTWSLGNHYITEIERYKYLGVIISRSYTDSDNINEVIKKGNRIIAYITSIINNQNDFNRVYYGDLLWRTIGLPTINYASAIWLCNSKGSLNKLENLQYQMARIILKAPRNVAKAALIGDLGWETLYTIQNKFRMSYCNRIKNMDDQRWQKLLCRSIMDVEDKVKWKWINHIKDLLCKFDLGNKFNLIPESQWFKSFTHANSLENIKEWLEGAKTKSTLSEYLKYKHEPKAETYMFDMVNFASISLKFKARSNSLDLEGRKNTWSENETGFCKLCNNQLIETTDHFLLECSNLKNVRETHFNLLKMDLLYCGYDTFWENFRSGTIEYQHHILLDDLYLEFPFERIGEIVDIERLHLIYNI